MTTFIPIIISASIFALIAQKYQKNKQLLYINSLFAIIIPVYFAYARNLTVGFDVMYYEYDIFKDAYLSKSFWTLQKDYFEIEPIFLFINYLSSSLSNDIHLALGLISLVTILPAYLAFYKLRKEIPFGYIYSLFLLYHYATSLNILRQSIAVGIILYLFAYFRINGLNYKTFILMFLSYFSHYTSIFFIIIILSSHFVKNIPSKKRNKLLILITISFIIAYTALNSILEIISFITGKDYSRYTSYSETMAGWAKPFFSWPIFFYCVICLYIYYKKNNFLSDKEKCLDYLCIISCIFITFLGKYTGSIGRLNLYFIIPIIYYVLITLNRLKLNKQKKNIIKLIIYVIFIYLHTTTIYKGFEFTSKILNIK